MAIYGDLYSGGNRSGVHYFDAAVLADPVVTAGLEEVAHPTATNVDGPVLRLRDATTRALVLDGVVIGQSGRPTRDAGQDIAIVPIEKLIDLPGTAQDLWKTYEQVPGGRREGVLRPPRVR